MDYQEAVGLASGFRVVAMCGVSGSGKTEFAKALERHGFVRVSSDRLIWREYGDRFLSLTDGERMSAFKAVDGEIAREVESLINRGEKIVIDSTMCKIVKRDVMREICRRAGVDLLFIYLQADKKLLLKRLSVRKGRGCDDQIIAPQQLEQFCCNFESPLGEENIVTVEQTE